MSKDITVQGAAIKEPKRRLLERKEQTNKEPNSRQGKSKEQTKKEQRADEE
jgi:hypothetical protein